MWLYLKMVYLESWEEFEQAAERLYLQDPMKCRYAIKIFYLPSYIERICLPNQNQNNQSGLQWKYTETRCATKPIIPYFLWRYMNNKYYKAAGSTMHEQDHKQSLAPSSSESKFLLHLI